MHQLVADFVLIAIRYLAGSGYNYSKYSEFIRSFDWMKTCVKDWDWTKTILK